MKVIDWKSLCQQSDSSLRSRVVAYEFSNGRKFYEQADAVYPEIDLYPSNLLHPEETLYPDGDN